MTNSIKHTRGPWYVSGKATINAYPGGWIASVSTLDRTANARLIAAAPDLLAALRGLVAKSTDIDGDWSAEWLAAFNAIARAEGRS
jgi:hypothetical protein